MKASTQRWFMPWKWTLWKRWILALGLVLAAYVLSFDLVRFVLISIGKSDWWWVLFQTVYAPVRDLRRMVGIWP